MSDLAESLGTDPDLDMDGKILKLKTHPRNYCGKNSVKNTLVCFIWSINTTKLAEEELIVNIDVLSKEKLHLEAGDIIAISAPAAEENESRLYKPAWPSALWLI